MLLWHTLATYFRRKYGVRVQKIPLDAGATCPNRDGTLSARGCIFCNDSGSGSGMGLRGLDLRVQWDAWYAKYTTTDSDRLFMAYLQSFSNTYGPASRLARLLEQVAALPGCRGIAVGTRPDCLDDEKLALLAGCGLDEVWLELGLQTCRDDTLRRINRGHTARQAEEAVALWREEQRLPWTTASEAAPQRPAPCKRKKLPQIAALQKSLCAALPCKARVSGDMESGRITLRYTSPQELEALLNRLHCHIPEDEPAGEAIAAPVDAKTPRQ